MPEVREQAIRDIDRSGSEPHALRTQRDARLRQAIAIDQNGRRVRVQVRQRTAQHFQSERGVADRSGHEHRIARPCAGPSNHFPNHHLT